MSQTARVALQVQSIRLILGIQEFLKHPTVQLVLVVHHFLLNLEDQVALKVQVDQHYLGLHFVQLVQVVLAVREIRNYHLVRVFLVVPVIQVDLFVQLDLVVLKVQTIQHHPEHLMVLMAQQAPFLRKGLILLAVLCHQQVLMVQKVPMVLDLQQVLADQVSQMVLMDQMVLEDLLGHLHPEDQVVPQSPFHLQILFHLDRLAGH